MSPSRPDEVFDGKYYQAAPPGSVAERLVIRARSAMFQDFMRLCRPAPSDEILDVGVSEVVGESPNFLERLYPFREKISAVGLGDGRAFSAEFPSVGYAQVAPGAPLPFDAGRFPIATSNAVLEHVGSVEGQRRFVAELLRVARTVFLTVPNRFFPVEHHTGIPFFHFSELSFRFACRALGKGEWSEASNLILMSRVGLRACFDGHGPVEIGWTGLRLGPFSSNLYAYASRA